MHSKGVRTKARHVVHIAVDGGFRIDAEPLVHTVAVRKRHTIVEPEKDALVAQRIAQNALFIDRIGLRKSVYSERRQQKVDRKVFHS